MEISKTRRYKVSQAYFRGVLATERKIQCLEAEIEKQQSRLALNGVEYGESVSKTLEGDAFEKGFMSLYDYCDKMDGELALYVKDREAAMECLANLEDGNMYQVIFLRYFEGLSFRDIQSVMFSSERSVFYYHERGLCKLFDKLPLEFKCAVKCSTKRDIM